MLQIPNHQLEDHSPYFEVFARATSSIVHLPTQALTKSLTTTNKNIQVTLQFETYHSQEFKHECLIYLQKEPANFPSQSWRIFMTFIYKCNLNNFFLKMAHVLFNLHPHQKIVAIHHGRLVRLWHYLMVYGVHFEHRLWYTRFRLTIHHFTLIRFGTVGSMWLHTVVHWIGFDHRLRQTSYVLTLHRGKLGAYSNFTVHFNSLNLTYQLMHFYIQ
jgi:hypothetical protein